MTIHWILDYKLLLLLLLLLLYAGAFTYADDIHVASVSPSIYGLKKMISICESYERDYHINFNSAKSKLICFNASSFEIYQIYLNGTPVTLLIKINT